MELGRKRIRKAVRACRMYYGERTASRQYPPNPFARIRIGHQALQENLTPLALNCGFLGRLLVRERLLFVAEGRQGNVEGVSATGHQPHPLPINSPRSPAVNSC